MDKVEYKVANRWRRAGGILIDIVVVNCLILSLLMFPIGIVNVLFLLALMAVMLIPVKYVFYLFKDVYRGISPGKWIMGTAVRVSYANDEIPPFKELVTLNGSLLIFPIDAIHILINKDKLRLSEKATDTTVVLNPMRSSVQSRLIKLVILLGTMYFLVVGARGMYFRTTDYYTQAIENIEKDEKILEVTGGIIGYGWFPNGFEAKSQYGYGNLYIKVIGRNKTVNVYVRIFTDEQSKGKWIAGEPYISNM